MNRFNFRSIKGRLIISYGSMALLWILVVVLTLWQIGQIRELRLDVLESKQPSLLYLQQAMSGVHQSNSVLQTYLLTGNDDFKSELGAVWEKEINPAENSLDLLITQWANLEKVVEYEKFRGLISRIKSKQQEVISSANFGGGAPTLYLNDYPDLVGDTIMDIGSLQEWINASLANSSGGTNANGAIFIENVNELSESANRTALSLIKYLADSTTLTNDEINDSRQLFIMAEAALISIAILLSFLLFRYVLKKVNSSINILSEEVNTLSDGNIPHERKRTGDELDLVLEKIDVLSKNLADVKLFALEVGKGSFDNDISVFNNEGEIGQSLAEMRESLKKVSEDAKIRNWSNKGAAELGETLRKHSNDLNQLTSQVVSYLVKYTDSNQGSLFVVEENDEGERVLELKASYAYDRKKFIEKTVAIGQGLLGQAFLEEESIYLKDIPQNYATVTSGLGHATPTAIFIMPLIVNEQVYGIIELGSFTDFDIHKRNFIEGVSETLAATIQSVKINERTTILLEESQQMTETMRAQEEEMRQNMEELQATQEEMERSQKESGDRLSAIENSEMGFIEFDGEGYILQADDTFIKLFEYSDVEEIKGKHHKIFVSPDYAKSEDYRMFWEQLRNGINVSGQFNRLTKLGNDRHIRGAYSVLKDNEGQAVRIMKFAVDVTDLASQLETDRAQQEDLLAEINNLKSSLVKHAETSNRSSDLEALKAYNTKLENELMERLNKNEEQLRAALDQQRKDYNL